jgi:hypothetical protein
MAKIDQDAQSKSGFFQTAPSSSTNVSNFKNNVTNALETNVSDSQILNIMNSVFNKNTKTVTFGNCDGKSNLDFSQDIVSQLVTEGIQKAVSEAVQNAETTTKQEIGVSQKSTSKGGGLEDVIAALLAPLTALGTVGAIICALICCCCCIVIMVGGMGGGGGATSTVIPVPGGAANALSPANLAKVAQSLKG